jgi:hypothetical protein
MACRLHESVLGRTNQKLRVQNESQEETGIYLSLAIDLAVAYLIGHATSRKALPITAFPRLAWLLAWHGLLF